MNDRLRDNEVNLESAYQSLIDHQEALALERERFENEIIMYEEEFSRWAKRYIAKDDGIQSFLDWCWTRHARTLKPGWTQAWEERV
jgi:hypothetical protein